MLFVTVPEKGRMRRAGEEQPLSRLERMMDTLTKIRGKRSGLQKKKGKSIGL